MDTYNFGEFLREELGGDPTRRGLEHKTRALDYILGQLLVFLSLEKPPKELSFNTALVQIDAAKDQVQVAHDIYEDKFFCMSREDLTRAVKDAIAASREGGSGGQ